MGKETKDSIGFSESSLKEAVKHSIVTKLLESLLGIYPASFWANIFLYAYEVNFMTDLISLEKDGKARHFH